jgi:hypothetical protein
MTTRNHQELSEGPPDNWAKNDAAVVSRIVEGIGDFDGLLSLFDEAIQLKAKPTQAVAEAPQTAEPKTGKPELHDPTKILYLVTHSVTGINSFTFEVPVDKLTSRPAVTNTSVPAIDHYRAVSEQQTMRVDPSATKNEMRQIPTEPAMPEYDLYAFMSTEEVEKEYRGKAYTFSSTPKKRSQEMNSLFMRTLLKDISRQNIASAAVFLNTFSTSLELRGEILESLATAAKSEDLRATMYANAYGNFDLPSDDELEAFRENAPSFIADLRETNVSKSSDRPPEQPWTIEHTLISLATSGERRRHYPKILSVLNQLEESGVADAYARFGYWDEISNGGDEEERAMMQSFFTDNYPGHVAYRYDEIAQLQQTMQGLVGDAVTFEDDIFVDLYYHPEDPTARKASQIQLDAYHLICCIAQYGNKALSEEPTLERFYKFGELYDKYVDDPEALKAKLLRMAGCISQITKKLRPPAVSDQSTEID